MTINIREIFAEELRGQGAPQSLIDAVRDGSDNSQGGVAAIRAIQRVMGEIGAADRSEVRQEVYNAFDNEREYQEHKWGPRSRASITEFMAFTLDYVMQGLKAVTRHGEAGTDEALHCARKIGSMQVALMEQHGVLYRPHSEHAEVNPDYSYVAAADVPEELPATAPNPVTNGMVPLG